MATTETTYGYYELDLTAQRKAYENADDFSYNVEYCVNEVVQFQEAQFQNLIKLYGKCDFELELTPEDEFKANTKIDENTTEYERMQIELQISIATSQANIEYIKRCSKEGWEQYMFKRFPNAQYTEDGEIVSYM